MPIPPARPVGAPRRLLRRGTPGSAPTGSVPTGARRRSVVLLAVAGLTAGLLMGVAGPAAADPTPPPYVSDGQLGAAQANKTQLATQVGALTAQLSQLQLQVQQLQAASELAEQKYAYAAQQLEDAKTAATQAKADVATAQAAVETARAAFNAAVRANYTQGSVDGGAGALLASDDPDEILQAAATQRYVTSHQADGIGQLDRATVAKANADARARTAVATQTQLAAAAQTAFEDAQASQAAAQSQQASLATQTAGVQAQLDTAQATLLGLQNQRAAYDAWKAEQDRLAREAAAAKLAQQIAQQEAAARALAASGGSRPAGSGGSSGGSGGGSSAGTGGSPSGGAWSAAKGQQAVNRAMQWIGTPYAWNGGNANGPTYGQCVSGAASNDCHIKGFDCSGLVLYGWAPFMAMPHYTVAMWSLMAGSYHPRTSDLMPGDLLFYGGSASTIHHVAMYIGGGNVVQAPQSGDHVRVTPLYAMGSDYYGAVRPLS